MDEHKRFIIDTIYNARGLKTYTQDMNRARRVAKVFGIGLSKQAKILEKTTSQSYNKQGDAVRRTTTIMEDQGKKVRTVYDQIGKKVKIVNGTFTKSQGALSKTGNELKKLVTRAGLVIPVWLLLRGAMMATLRVIKESIKFMVEWEYQLAQIRLVGDSTEAQINNLSSSLLRLSTSLGISNGLLGEGAKLFIQQGRAIEEIVPLMESTAKLSLLTGRTIVQSVEDLTAVLKAYKLEASDASSIVDLITATMLKHAITASDLASAYKATASTAEALGVSLASLTGFVTAIKVVTRDTGTKVGTALRTMFSRISTSSAESLQKLTQVPFYLDKMGKTTSKVTPRMRNMSTIISEMALVFGTLENAQQSQIAKLIGGIRRQNQVFALFNNFTEAVEAQTDALLGLGKADEAIAKLTDTTKIGIEQLKGAWGEWVDVVGDTQIFKSSLDFIKNQILGAITLLDPARAFAIGFGQELRKQGELFVQEGKFVEGIEEIQKELLEMQEIASRTTDVFQLEQLAQRTRVYAKAFYEAFAEHGIEVPINPKLEDWKKLSKIIEQTMPELFELDVKAKVDLDTLNLKQQLLDLSETLRYTFQEKEIQNMNKAVYSLNPALKVLQKTVKGIEFIGARKSLEKLAKGMNLSKKEFKELEKAGQKVFKDNELEGFLNLLKKVDSISSDIVDVDQRRIDKIKELTTKAENHKKIQILEAEIKRKLNSFDREAIKLNLDRLTIVNGMLKILENIDNVTGSNQDNQIESLKTEKYKLEVLKDRNKLQAKQDILLNKLKVSGASKLQILIQELAYLEQINAHEDKRLEKQKQIAIERQNLEVTTLNTILQGQLGILKAQGASEIQIIKTRIEMEKKLGIEKKGLAYLKQQFEIQQAITKETKRTRQERQADLKAAIIKKRKEEFEADPFRQAEFKTQERRMESQAKEAGLTQEEIDAILRPTEDLEADLPQSMQDLVIENGVLSDSMFTLQGAIENLTNTILGKPVEFQGDLGLPSVTPLGEKGFTPTQEQYELQQLEKYKIPEDVLRARQEMKVTPKEPSKFVITIGETVFHIEGGTSEEVLEQIDKKIGSFKTELPAILAKKIKDANDPMGKAVGERIVGD